MLALATAAHGGHDPTQVLILLAAAGAAFFWRGLIKVALTFIVILVAVLLVFGIAAFAQGFH